jgi:hypothetical protein
VDGLLLEEQARCHGASGNAGRSDVPVDVHGAGVDDEPEAAFGHRIRREVGLRKENFASELEQGHGVFEDGGERLIADCEVEVEVAPLVVFAAAMGAGEPGGDGAWVGLEERDEAGEHGVAIAGTGGEGGGHGDRL